MERPAHSVRISLGEIITLNCYMTSTKLQGKVPYLVPGRRFLIWSPVRREIPSYCNCNFIVCSTFALSCIWTERFIRALRDCPPFHRHPCTLSSLRFCELKVTLGDALNRFAFNTRKMKENLKGNSRRKLTELEEQIMQISTQIYYGHFSANILWIYFCLLCVRRRSAASAKRCF